MTSNFYRIEKFGEFAKVVKPAQGHHLKRKQIYNIGSQFKMEIFAYI